MQAQMTIEVIPKRNAERGPFHALRCLLTARLSWLEYVMPPIGPVFFYDEILLFDMF